MATKKQRKRRYIPPANEVKHLHDEELAESRDRHVRTIHSSKSAPRTGAKSARGGELPVPSIKRTIKRLPIYFALIFLLQFYLSGSQDKNLDTAQRAILAAGQAGLVTLAFAPFMHIMDRWTYNRMQKRALTSGSAKGTQGKA